LRIPANPLNSYDFLYVIFLHKSRTADFQTTKGLLGILEREKNSQDIVAFLEERNLPLEEVGRQKMAERIINEPPVLGYLTVSNALQWRLQYGRIVTMANEGNKDGMDVLVSRGK